MLLKKGVLKHPGAHNKLCRVVVDVEEKKRILNSLHADPVGGGHYGQTATIKKVTDRVWWRNVSTDARNFVQNRFCNILLFA